MSILSTKWIFKHYSTQSDFLFFEWKFAVFDKWLWILEQNFVAHFLCPNIPRLSVKYFILFIYKLLVKGRTRALRDLCAATMQPKTSQLLLLLSYSKLKLMRLWCSNSTEQNKQLTLPSAQACRYSILTKRLTVSSHDTAKYATSIPQAKSLWTRMSLFCQHGIQVTCLHHSWTYM